MSAVSFTVVGAEDKVKKLKQRRNGFLSNLSKVINRAEMYLTDTILKEIGILKKKLKFALFTLQSNTEEICALTSVEDEKKYYESFNENNERANIIINNLENYLDQAEVDIQSVISDYALEYLYNTQLKTGRSESKGSSKSSSKGSSEKESLALLQNQSRAKRNIKLLEARQKLERAQAEEDYLRAKEIRELTQASTVSVSNEVLRDLGRTCEEFINRHTLRI